MNRKLPRSFYNRPTLQVARELLGKIISYRSRRGMLSGRIVEVEAYIGEDDPACHAAPGPTKRNQIMYGKAGFSYIYFIYGMYYCFNVVTERAGFPAAVLVRAAEPLNGIHIMREHSPRSRPSAILSGPGKFCRSFGLTTRQSGVDLTGPELFLCDDGSDAGEIIVTRRIGINKGDTLPYRFFVAGSEAVSGPRELRHSPIPTGKF
ncbi:MAG: DNA-3-methyladenine glycosylase [Candidatus Zixiibacteriota bacterium]